MDDGDEFKISKNQPPDEAEERTKRFVMERRIAYAQEWKNLTGYALPLDLTKMTETELVALLLQEYRTRETRRTSETVIQITIQATGPLTADQILKAIRSEGK